MFDLETVSFSNEVWSIGWQMPSGVAHDVFITADRWVADHVAEDGAHISVVRSVEEAWTRFAAVVQDAPALYSWGSYDRVKLKATAPLDVQAMLLGRIQDIKVIVKRGVALPIRSWRLADVADCLGFAWRTDDDCFEAHNNFTKWVAGGDLGWLGRACIYQLDDVAALVWIWRWLVNGGRT